MARSIAMPGLCDARRREKRVDEAIRVGLRVHVRTERAKAECARVAQRVRRLEELRKNGVTTDCETVLADIKARDSRDMSRQDAPLIAAQDAKVIDTSDLTIDQSTERAVTLIQAALGDID